ncbi:hypothetical protein M433DRAFT_140019 [Acidomyces richmondensis BFW]|nr:MAG: hypothetical protein FE78DRAFT_82231 [Acidomyces sp. 'richmondensis']KYG49501.1 hypothetical protein M433DRAFT_140019 [Acidomyces richmondensis BFW]
MASTDKYKLVYFTPPQYLSDINAAIFATGAGVYGEYSEVCFTTLGVGQFRPSSSANPTIGRPGKLEQVGEVRCEILCVGPDITQAAVAALKKVHPYEEVAYEVYKVEPF